MRLLLAVTTLALAAQHAPPPPAKEAPQPQPYSYSPCPETSLEPYCCRKVMHTPEGKLEAKKCRAYPKSHRSFEDFEEACNQSGGGTALCCKATQTFKHAYVCAEPAAFGTGGPRAGLGGIEEEEGGVEDMPLEDGEEDDNTAEEVLGGLETVGEVVEGLETEEEVLEGVNAGGDALDEDAPEEAVPVEGGLEGDDMGEDAL